MNKLISSIDPDEQDDAPTNMALSQKRPRWARHFLQNAEEHEVPHGADGRPYLLPEGSLRKRESIMMRHFILWLDILPSYRLLLQLWDGSCIRWMLRLPFSMVLLRKKYILNNQRGLLSMERSLTYAS